MSKTMALGRRKFVQLITAAAFYISLMTGKSVAVDGVELLVRVKDKKNPDSPYLDCKCAKAGDVIVACPWGWEWTSLEVSNPDWIIVRVVGMGIEEGTALTVIEPGDSRLNKMLHRHAFSLDLKKLGDARTISADELRAIKTLKRPLNDPAIFGTTGYEVFG